MYKLKIHIVFLCIIVLLTNCHEQVEQDSRVFPLRLVVPVDMSQSSVRKIMGDPGSAEALDLPHYAYVFTVFKKIDGGYDIKKILQSDLYESGKTDSEVWTPVYTGADIVYRCLINLEAVTPVLGQVEYCHVYAAVSKVPLTLSNTNPIDEDEVRNITFKVNSDVKQEMQNIYSTPYNNFIDGKYYGRVNVRQDVVTTDLMLYHVASKVDLMWNVEESVQTQMRVTNMKVTHLYDGPSYLFRPTDNQIAEAAYSGGYVHIVTDNNIGMQWEGRHYFYAIPYRNNANKCPLLLEMQANGNTAGSYKETVLNDPSSPFVPWIRGQINITKNIEGDYN